MRYWCWAEISHEICSHDILMFGWNISWRRPYNRTTLQPYNLTTIQPYNNPSYQFINLITQTGLLLKLAHHLRDFGLVFLRMIMAMGMKGELTYDAVGVFLLEPWQGGEDEAQGGDDYKHARDHCYHLQMQMFNVQVQMFKGGVAGKSDSRWLLSESELALHIHLWRISPREWDIGHLQKRKTKVSFCLQDGDNDDLSSTWIVRIFEKVPEPFLGDRAHPVPKLLLHIVTLPGREGNQNQPTRKDGCPKYLPISLASVVSTIVNIASFHNWQCKSSRFYRCLGFPPLKLGLSLDAEMKRKEQLTTFEAKAVPCPIFVEIVPKIFKSALCLPLLLSKTLTLLQLLCKIGKKMTGWVPPTFHWLQFSSSWFFPWFEATESQRGEIFQQRLKFCFLDAHCHSNLLPSGISGGSILR